MSVRQERPNPHDLPAVPASPGVRSGRRRGQLPLPGIEEQEQSHRAALPRAIVLRGAIGRCVGELPVTVFRAGPSRPCPLRGFPSGKNPGRETPPLVLWSLHEEPPTCPQRHATPVRKKPRTGVAVAARASAFARRPTPSLPAPGRPVRIKPRTGLPSATIVGTCTKDMDHRTRIIPFLSPKSRRDKRDHSRSRNSRKSGKGGTKKASIHRSQITAYTTF